MNYVFPNVYYRKLNKIAFILLDLESKMFEHLL